MQYLKYIRSSKIVFSFFDMVLRVKRAVFDFQKEHGQNEAKIFGNYLKRVMALGKKLPNDLYLLPSDHATGKKDFWLLIETLLLGKN